MRKSLSAGFILLKYLFLYAFGYITELFLYAFLVLLDSIIIITAVSTPNTPKNTGNREMLMLFAIRPKTGGIKVEPI